ncbi:MAG: hypothetical protein HZB26_07270 [Candidatus Hydrogenedentes bacterium]|nr:hypothetical protein [Candidatus Hydrogenedentota bacterium]
MPQYDGPERNACLPHDDKGLPGRSNIDLLRLCGQSAAAIRGIEARASARGMDSLVLFCEERGVTTIDSLLT